MLSCAALASIASAGGLSITSYTIDGGGGTSSGGNLEVSGTIGQHDAGRMSGGNFELSGGFWTPAPECAAPAPAIVHSTGQPSEEEPSTVPCTGYVDPRLESNDGSTVNLGLTQAGILFNTEVYGNSSQGPITVANFTLAESGGASPPTVLSANPISGNQRHVLVQWNRPITLGEWTTLRASVWNCAGQLIANSGDLGVPEVDRIDFAFLPADIDGNGRVQALDLLRMRQRLANTCTSACPDCGGRDEFYFDIDRNGSVAALDLLRWRQLWFGTGTATQVWQSEELSTLSPP
jgi:hypothetical protein